MHDPKNAPPIGRGTILLVEDREEDVFFLRRAFSRIGADVEVRVVRNGAEAQAYMNGEPPFADRKYYPLPDIIVCDFKMPRRGGVDFLQWLRRQRDFESLPFILLSGSVLPHEQQLALKLGADLYLRKTADFGQMTEHARVILQFLERRGTSDFRRQPASQAPKDRTVLIIEDEASVRRMLADVLESAGFGALPAETSSEGLACARTHRPDVVLCDVVLPDAIGFETAKALNEQPATRDVPVILMTGYTYMRDLVPQSKWMLLLKPLSAIGITEAVMNALQPARQVA